MAPLLRIGVLVSGGGTNLQAIIDACAAGKIDGQVVFVGSDNPLAYGLERANRACITTFVVDYATLFRELKQNPGFPAPPDYDPADVLAKHQKANPTANPEKAAVFLRKRAFIEARLLEKMAARPFDLLVLAGFMRTLSPYFIDRVNTNRSRLRIINIHPSLLPAFAGLDGYGDTFRYGCKVAGCTVHFVDYGADTGPIIAQKAFAIEPQDTLESVRAKGLELEWELYPYCIQLFAHKRLLIEPCSLCPQGTCDKRRVVRILDPS